MVDKIFSSDAYLNYFAEFLGIIITVILIPVVLNFYIKRKNKNKKFLADSLLMTKLNSCLDKLVPSKYRDFEKGVIWKRKNVFSFGLIQDTHILPFSIKYLNADSIIDYFNIKFETLKKNKEELKFNKISTSLHEIRTDLENFFMIYGDVFDKKIYREYYLINYHIQSIDLTHNKNEYIYYYSESESISIIINCLDSMRALLLKKHKEIDKEHYIQSIKYMFSERLKESS